MSRDDVGARAWLGGVTPPWLDLTGRTALVSGAGSPTGIGLACARHLAQLGARVVVTATTDRVHERVADLREEGFAAAGRVVDLTDPAQVDDLVTHLTADGLSPDVLVNNAGMTSVTSPAIGDVAGSESGRLADLSPATWHASLARNLDTAYLLTRAVLPAMLARRWGRVVMVASVTGPVMAMRGEPAYAAAKAGLVGLARAVAVDHAGDGVTCNAVAPGWIATGSQTEDEARQSLVTPTGRAGTAEEVAAAVAMLCLPGAGYLTGQLVTVDGGNSVAEERAG